MIKQIELIKAAKVSEILKSPELCRFVLIIYNELFDKSNKRFCASAISEFAKAIKKDGLKKLEEMKKPRKYVLKNNISIYLPESFKTITNDNLTDKIAIDLLKKYPKFADKFEPFKTEK